MPRRRRIALTTIALSFAVVHASSIPAAMLPAAARPGRTTLVSSVPGGVANGASHDQALSADGRVVAFDSTATNLVAAGRTPAVSNVYTVNLTSGARSVVSGGLGGGAANGPSSAPVLSGTGRRVAFASSASNLVAGDTNGAADIFVRDGAGPIALVSVGLGGAPANGPSKEAAMSRDGRFVVFTSMATNLVLGHHGPVPQVYVRDLATGVTALVSASDGSVANRASDSPAISPDGRAVTFESAATNLDPRTRSGVPNIYLRRLSAASPARGGTQAVSLSTRGVPQNRGVAGGYEQISGVSEGGQSVVFDSQATNLVPGATSGRSEVYLRDVARGSTSLVSESSDGHIADNDSFAPSITAGGHFVVFESLATNLAGGGGPRENLYMRDLHLSTTSVVDVGAFGSRPGPESTSQLLQRPVLSDDASFAVFTSTATGLTSTPTAGLANVYVRNMTAPRLAVARLSSTRRGGSITISLRADDPHADMFLCRIDGGLYFICPAGTSRLPRQSPGHHVLLVRAGGPGLLYARRGVRLRFTTLP